MRMCVLANDHHVLERRIAGWALLVALPVFRLLEDRGLDLCRGRAFALEPLQLVLECLQCGTLELDAVDTTRKRAGIVDLDGDRLAGYVDGGKRRIHDNP